MKQTIAAKEKELGDIFCDKYVFQIPSYQRPYAWTTEQTEELLDDLLAAMDDDQENPYFLGSIVLIKDDSPRAQVVDGQQRLTTLTILFCVLRELSEDGDLLDKYVWQKKDPIAGTEERYRLTLRERDKKFFRRKIQATGKLKTFLEMNKEEFTSSQQSMYENAKWLWNRLSTLEQSRRQRLAAFLVQYCYLVVVSASDQDSAYRIFSVMNTRGLNLSPTDILKASIIGAMPEGDRANYTNQWEEIEESLGRDKFGELFAHIRMIYMKSKARKSLNQEFNNGVLTKVNGQKFIDDVLQPLSKAYEIISKANYRSAGDAEKVNVYLRHLRRLDNSDWVPSAIAFFEKQQHNEDALFQFFRDLERLAYALFVARKNVSARIEKYRKLLNAIETNDLSAVTSALQLADNLKSAVITSLHGPIYLQAAVRRPILLRLDSLLADEGVVYEYEESVLSIEHVLPQTPPDGSKWLKWFPEENTRKIWTHRLANLVLLSRRKNTRAQNFDFKQKKEEYFGKGGVTTFPLTIPVLRESKWTPAVLENRQNYLIDQLKREWRLD